jgi:hypothetical protein
MRPRFVVDVVTSLAAGFLIAASFAFNNVHVGWLGFGVFVALLVANLGAAALDRRNTARAAHLLAAAGSVWAIVASRVYSGSTMTWLVFADAAAIGLIALADLVGHELSTERVVHTLEVSSEAPTTDRVAVDLAA